MSEWNKIGFGVEQTGDGSVSLFLLQKILDYREHGETMHHSGGAATETALIYGQVIRECLEKIPKPKFLVVGLGLGYIELNIIKELLLAGKSVEEHIGAVISYESVPELKQFFLNWIFERDLPLEIKETYDAVLSSVLKDSALNRVLFMEALKALYNSQEKAQILGAIESDYQTVNRYHCICYDAFSSRTTPHLWEEAFLTNLVEVSSEAEAYFSTYSCRNSLKNSLKKAGFEITPREGFQNKKKKSTLAYKKLK